MRVGMRETHLIVAREIWTRALVKEDAELEYAQWISASSSRSFPSPVQCHRHANVAVLVFGRPGPDQQQSIAVLC